MDQARFNFLVIAYILLSIFAIAAFGYAVKAAQELKSEKLRSFEFKQMYLSEVKRHEKLVAENSVFRLYIQTNDADKQLNSGGRVWPRK